MFKNLIFFSRALLELYLAIFNKYNTFTDPKPSFKWYLYHCCDGLKVLAYISRSESKRKIDYFNKKFEKLEYSEVLLYTEWRKITSSLSLKDEIWLYDTLLVLFK